MHKKNVLVPVVNGIEEIEAVTIIDVLRRAGVGVRVSSIGEREVVSANGVKLVADSLFADEVLENFDGIILPGGTDGAKSFAAHAGVIKAIKDFNDQKLLVAAICASPGLALASAGILANKRATGYPSLKDKIPHYVDEPVVIDENIVTSQGPATALRFALKLAEILAGETVAREVKAGMLA